MKYDVEDMYGRTHTECETCPKTLCPAKRRLPLEKKSDHRERQALCRRMCRIKEKIVVLSGKGGVGKSTVAASLAISLSLQGKRTGLLDTDLHGPSIPSLLKLEAETIQMKDGLIRPALYHNGLKVMSVGFLLEQPQTPLIWRGPKKYSLIKQFLKDVEWGELDYLIVDSPPGTGDEPLTCCQLLGDPKSAIIVTTPQELALVDVRRSVVFCQRLNLPIRGVVENMCGFVCPNCKMMSDIFGRGGAEAMATEMGLRFLGRIPVDPALVESCDRGAILEYLSADTRVAKAVRQVIQRVVQRKADDGDSAAKKTPRAGAALAKTPPCVVPPVRVSAGAAIRGGTDPLPLLSPSRVSPMKQGLPTKNAGPAKERNHSVVGYCGLACGLCAYSCEPTCRSGGGSEDCYQRACSIGKGIDGCWQCDEFPCNEGSFSEHNGSTFRGVCLASCQCIKERGIFEYLRLLQDRLGVDIDYTQFKHLRPDEVDQRLFSA